jgi:hypothetical protein
MAAQRAACFRAAHLYLSMSQDESAGWAVVEAMHRGLPVVAYGATPIAELMDGAGVVSPTLDPAEVGGMLGNLDRKADARTWLIARERQRAQDFSADKALAALRTALVPVLDKPPLRALRPPPDLPAVQLVCPALDAAPEHPLSRAARLLAVSLGARCEVSILTVKADGVPPGPAPERVMEGMTTLLKYSPDVPILEGQALPRSSSLESAVRSSEAPVVYLDTRERIARALLADTAGRAFAVDGPEGLDQAVQAIAAQVLARVG